MHVATSIGPGMKSCTLSGFRPRRFRYNASSIIAGRSQPGCPAMKYGTRNSLLAGCGRLLVGTAGQTPRTIRSAACSSAATPRDRRARARPSAGRRCDVGDLANVLRALHGQVHANARGHQRLLHARLPPRGIEQFASAAHGRSPIAGRSSGAGSLAAGIFRVPRAASNSSPYMLAVGPPRSLTVPEKSGSSAHASDFRQDRRLAAALNDAALVNA